MSRMNALQFSNDSRRKIMDRDNGCIFCNMYYYAPRDKNIFDLAHVVNKSQGGLGIEQNGVMACRYHHYQMDNGSMPELREKAEEYLKEKYPGWTRENVKYNKWRRE